MRAFWGGIGRVSVVFMLVMVLVGTATAGNVDVGPFFNTSSSATAAQDTWARTFLAPYAHSAYASASWILGQSLPLGQRISINFIKPTSTQPGLSCLPTTAGAGNFVINVYAPSKDLPTAAATLAAYGAAIAQTTTALLFLYKTNWTKAQLAVPAALSAQAATATLANSGVTRISMIGNALGQYVKNCVYAYGPRFNKTQLASLLDFTTDTTTRSNGTGNAGWLGAADDYRRGTNSVASYGASTLFGDVDLGRAKNMSALRLTALGYFIANSKWGVNIATFTTALKTAHATYGTNDKHGLSVFSTFGNTFGGGYSSVWDDAKNNAALPFNDNPYSLNYCTYFYGRGQI